VKGAQLRGKTAGVNIVKTIERVFDWSGGDFGGAGGVTETRKCDGREHFDNWVRE
jgi:hypothetical protein